MIRRIEIENLGPIQKASLELSPLTVLLGANASGKTSVLRALEFFAQVRAGHLVHAGFGGFHAVADAWLALVHGGKSHRIVRLAAWVDRLDPQPMERAHYEVEIGVDPARTRQKISESGPEAGFDVEILRDSLIDTGLNRYIEAGLGRYSIRSLEVGERRPRTTSLPFDITVIARSGAMGGFQDLDLFVQSFGAARYFKPVGLDMSTITADERVHPVGAGFVQALAELQNRDSRLFSRIEDALRTRFPHIEAISMPSNGRTKHLEFLTSRSGTATPGDLEADGVLTTLFILWAAFSSPPESILLLDDPESGLHPHLMADRLSFLRDLASGKLTGHQVHVVAATQSAEFVRYLDIDEVRIVEYVPDVGTQVRRADASDDVKRLVEKFGSNTGDLWYSGALGGVPTPRT